MFGPGGPSLVELVVEGLMATDKGYDHLAPKFDATPFRTPDVVLDKVAEHLARGPRIGRVLDLCCGTGAVFRRWNHLFDEGVGVDFSPGMLAEAARFEPPGGAKLSWVQGDVVAYTPDRPFDVVTSFGAFGHFEPKDQPAFLATVRRALAPGGRFVFVTGPAPGLSEAQYWAARTFNLAMRVRNAVIRPPFVMYYLTYQLDEALARCRDAGLDPIVTPLGWEERPRAVIVEAVRT